MHIYSRAEKKSQIDWKNQWKFVSSNDTVFLCSEYMAASAVSNCSWYGSTGFEFCASASRCCASRCWSLIAVSSSWLPYKCTFSKQWFTFEISSGTLASSSGCFWWNSRVFCSICSFILGSNRCSFSRSARTSFTAAPEKSSGFSVMYW